MWSKIYLYIYIICIIYILDDGCIFGYYWSYNNLLCKKCDWCLFLSVYIMNECKNFSFIDYCPQTETLPSYGVTPMLDPDFAFLNKSIIGIYVFVISYLVIILAIVGASIVVMIGLKYGRLRFRKAFETRSV